MPTAQAQRLWAGTLLLPLRLIVGWTYFSAFWRRVVLENKLSPDAPGYIGEKFNHFLPNALGIKPVIAFFVTHPELLWWKLLAFTVVEGVVGLALMAGLFTRLTGLATSALAFGILLGAGWLGTTCLDEWQIGILGVGAGLAFAFAGGGRYSLDHLLARRWGTGGARRVAWMGRVEAAWTRLTHRGVVVCAVAVLALTLFTNQVFHGGVWGRLHNKSVRPVVEISKARITGDALAMELTRVEGADVYGSFAIGVTLSDAGGAVIAAWSADELARLTPADIANRHVAQVKPGAHSLVIPLGALAEVTLHAPQLRTLAPGRYAVELADISGLRWTADVVLGG
ncbi:MAG: quinol oxidase [Phycisphaerales bacterium]|nr:quinol oxidase [Phycisphaerales bacterium]